MNMDETFESYDMLSQVPIMICVTMNGAFLNCCIHHLCRWTRTQILVGIRATRHQPSPLPAKAFRAEMHWDCSACRWTYSMT